MPITAETQTLGPVRISFWRPEVDREVTMCFVYRAGEEKNEFTGRAAPHSTDRFEKRTGRRIALTKAIASLPREDRRNIWAAYFRATSDLR